MAFAIFENSLSETYGFKREDFVETPQVSQLAYLSWDGVKSYGRLLERALYQVASLIDPTNGVRLADAVSMVQTSNFKAHDCGLSVTVEDQGEVSKYTEKNPPPPPVLHLKFWRDTLESTSAASIHHPATNPLLAAKPLMTYHFGTIDERRGDEEEEEEDHEPEQHPSLIISTLLN
ncbi:hypothetical protein BCR39DRAFT_586313 [Naematelia encephala]|uniref:Uncharacterized protein n=1 Tax=Naematelia encephala TaxID=71784 RepID=A0A1Y2BGI7_9TREE|nr:hypothetical protein BCR39DRAFT_586313 [Naematelia encephala]